MCNTGSNENTRNISNARAHSLTACLIDKERKLHRLRATTIMIIVIMCVDFVLAHANARARGLGNVHDRSTCKTEDRRVRPGHVDFIYFALVKVVENYSFSAAPLT